MDEGSDRYWWLDGTREWRVNVQHVQNGRLQTDLDRPIMGRTFIVNDIPHHWHLSPQAFAETDCVPLSLAHSLGENFDYVNKA